MIYAMDNGKLRLEVNSLGAEMQLSLIHISEPTRRS